MYCILISYFYYRSAYQHFSKANSIAIKEELIAAGKDASMGFISQAVSAKVCVCLFLNAVVVKSLSLPVVDFA